MKWLSILALVFETSKDFKWLFRLNFTDCISWILLALVSFEANILSLKWCLQVDLS